MKTKCYILALLLVMLGLPQRTSAQSPRRILYEVVDELIFAIGWSYDNPALVIIVTDRGTHFYDIETNTFYGDYPNILEHQLSKEEREALHVSEATNATVSISPDGRYVLYDSRDSVAVPKNVNEDELQTLLHPIYLADRQTRQYTLWKLSYGLNAAQWSPDSSGALVRISYWESSGIVTHASK